MSESEHNNTTGIRTRYFEAAVQHFNHYTTGSLSCWKFDHIDLEYRHKSESIIENETKSFRALRWTTPGQKSRPNVNKKKSMYHRVVFAIPTDHRIKMKTKSWTNTCILPENWKSSGSLGIWCWSLWNSSQDPGKETGGIECQKKNPNHLDHSEDT